MVFMLTEVCYLNMTYKESDCEDKTSGSKFVLFPPENRRFQSRSLSFSWPREIQTVAYQNIRSCGSSKAHIQY